MLGSLRRFGGDSCSSISSIVLLGDLGFVIFIGGLEARMKLEKVLDLERLSLIGGEEGGEEEGRGAVRVLGSSIG